jgi:uncharacterized membrane protein YeaQ/YmgE (transglycosylase-associated protein family)
MIFFGKADPLVVLAPCLQFNSSTTAFNGCFQPTQAHKCGGFIMFHFIGFLVTGFIVGLIARAILPGRDTMGIAMTTVLGCVGALLAGWIGSAAGWYGPEDGAGFIASTVGAIIVLAVAHLVTRGRSRSVLGTSSETKFPRRAA